MAELLDEGGAGSKLRSLIKRVGANTDTRIEFGTITSAFPSFSVLVDGMKIELDADDCVVAEHLTKHIRTVSINGGAASIMDVNSVLTVGARVIVAQINDGQTYVILDRIGAKEAY
ncbi:hypothetical protein BK120_08375 [Paenibacillus sp. FSL A5-0031]|uniref:DUF2577 family protein n=1 Tax=Paenibacillus sp. FSL A5-0031 TaxID=1920420 RepID=UPI00096D8B99|nr:DUF2577 family protein [Paenibacillus sp. FSL A5-0031]OME86929.1 hypothetical protein BK120_08375 [Paenibacillus sp. FSL A5-0031]